LTLAPTDSHMEATALMKEIFMARNAFEACLMSSALLLLVTMIGAGMEVRSAEGWLRRIRNITAGEWSVDLAKNGGTAVIVAADDDAIGKQEVGDGGAFAQNSGLEATSKEPGSAPLRRMICESIAGVDGDGAFSTMTL